MRKLVNKATLSILNKFERETSGKRVVRAEKGFNLFILNEDMDDIIRIINSLEDSRVLIDGITETVKNEIKKQEGGFLDAVSAPLAASLVQPVISSVVKGITRRGAMRRGRGYDKNV